MSDVNEDYESSLFPIFLRRSAAAEARMRASMETWSLGSGVHTMLAISATPPMLAISTQLRCATPQPAAADTVGHGQPHALGTRRLGSRRDRTASNVEQAASNLAAAVQMMVASLEPEPLCDGCPNRCAGCPWAWMDDDYLSEGGDELQLELRDAAARAELGLEPPKLQPASSAAASAVAEPGRTERDPKK